MNKEKQNKIEEIKVSPEISIMEALKKMDKSYKRLLFVFDKKKFYNLLSIGDIQRAIIKNYSLDTKIDEILRKDPRVSYSIESFEIIKNRMLRFKAESMPVLNEDKELVNAYFWEDIFPDEIKLTQCKLNLPVVIMAGGKGSRLKPITNVLPKPLIPIGEKTILEHIMNRFVEVGCNTFYMSVNYKAEMIKHYFKTLDNADYRINYFEEEKPLGTAGSLFLLKGKMTKTFFVSNCDIIIDEDYGEILDYHRKNKNLITVVAALKHYKIPYGTISTKKDGLLTELNEKPELTFKINSGMYILEPETLNEIPENEFFHITYLIEKIKNNGGRVGVFPVSENSWKDIGDWEEYLNNKDNR